MTNFQIRSFSLSLGNSIEAFNLRYLLDYSVSAFKLTWSPALKHNKILQNLSDRLQQSNDLLPFHKPPIEIISEKKKLEFIYGI